MSTVYKVKRSFNLSDVSYPNGKEVTEADLGNMFKAILGWGWLIPKEAPMPAKLSEADMLRIGGGFLNEVPGTVTSIIFQEPTKTAESAKITAEISKSIELDSKGKEISEVPKAVEAPVEVVKKKGGRPKGSKNSK